MLVVADTTPLNYLVLTDSMHALPALFREVVCPIAVQRELMHAAAPARVRAWAAAPPPWLSIREPLAIDPSLDLGPGENAAIALALELVADALLVDERDARALARRRGLQVLGTLAILDAAASRRLIDIREKIALLRTTTFHAREDLFEALIERQRRRDGGEPREP